MGLSISNKICIGVVQLSAGLSPDRITEEDTSFYLTEEDSSEIIIQEDAV